MSCERLCHVKDYLLAFDCTINTIFASYFNNLFYEFWQHHQPQFNRKCSKLSAAVALLKTPWGNLYQTRPFHEKDSKGNRGSIITLPTLTLCCSTSSSNQWSTEAETPTTILQL